MLHQIIASIIVLVIFGGGFMLVTVIRDRFMGPGVPSHFSECDSCHHKDEDCSEGCRLTLDQDNQENREA